MIWTSEGQALGDAPTYVEQLIQPIPSLVLFLPNGNISAGNLSGSQKFS